LIFPSSFEYSSFVFNYKIKVFFEKRIERIISLEKRHILKLYFASI